jgi:hypothetical protein
MQPVNGIFARVRPRRQTQTAVPSDRVVNRKRRAMSDISREGSIRTTVKFFALAAVCGSDSLNEYGGSGDQEVCEPRAKMSRHRLVAVGAPRKRRVQ